MSGLPATSGRFITLEGGEGVGKSTQLRRLAEFLRQRGLTVVETREPGGTEGAEAVRALLLSGETDRWNARAETLLFAAARSDHVERVIRPALAAGAWVLCDRYVDSSRAYQAAASGIADADVMEAHRIGSDGLMPDRTLLLTVPLGVAQERAARRDGGETDRFAMRGTAFHESVAAAFLRFAGEAPDRFRVIDSGAAPEAVTASIVAAVTDLLP